MLEVKLFNDALCQNKFQNRIQEELFYLTIIKNQNNLLKITKNRGLKMGVILLYSAVNGRGRGNMRPFGAKEQHDCSMIFMHIFYCFAPFKLLRFSIK